MKKVLLAGAALVALTFAGAASAADLPSRRAAPAPYIAPIFTWTGFYAGVNAGYAINGEDKLKFNNGAVLLPYGGSVNNTDDGSFTGGAQVGYNYQMGSVVVGVEADINFLSLEKKFGASVNDGIRNQSLEAKSKTEWFGTVRPRLGFVPVDRLLVFVTGGLAYGQVKTSTTYNDFNVNGLTGYAHSSKDDTRVGWTLGAGLEYAVTDNITVKGEYAYVDLGDKNHSTTGSDSLGNRVVFNAKDETNFHVVRAGLNYKF